MTKKMIQGKRLDIIAGEKSPCHLDHEDESNWKDVTAREFPYSHDTFDNVFAFECIGCRRMIRRGIMSARGNV